MTDNFKYIYKILSYLEKAMDYDRIDPDAISYESLGISEQRFRSILFMLHDSGYIKGLTYTTTLDDIYGFNYSNIAITLKGIEYLSENTIMKRLSNVAKGIVEVIK